MKPHKAICKNCGGIIEWLKGLGWTHLGKTNCKNPAPKRDTIEEQ